MKLLPTLLIASALLFTGCPMQGSFPLGKKTDKPLEKEMLGKWTANAWDQLQKLEISEAGEKGYFIKITSVNYDDTEHTTRFFLGWPAKFKGKTIMNLQKANSKGEATADLFYYFMFRYENGALSTTNLIEPMPSGGEIKFSNEDEWEKYLKEHWDDAGFWADQANWERGE